MGEEKGKIQVFREWIVEHKLRAVGNDQKIYVFLLFVIILCFKIGFLLVFFPFSFDWNLILGTLWASGIVGSMAYNWSQPNMKTSVKIIHARYASLFIFLQFISLRKKVFYLVWNL